MKMGKNDRLKKAIHDLPCENIVTGVSKGWLNQQRMEDEDPAPTLILKKHHGMNLAQRLNQSLPSRTLLLSCWEE